MDVVLSGVVTIRETDSSSRTSTSSAHLQTEKEENPRRAFIIQQALHIPTHVADNVSFGENCVFEDRFLRLFSTVKGVAILKLFGSTKNSTPSKYAQESSFYKQLIITSSNSQVTVFRDDETQLYGFFVNSYNSISFLFPTTSSRDNWLEQIKEFTTAEDLSSSSSTAEDLSSSSSSFVEEDEEEEEDDEEEEEDEEEDSVSGDNVEHGWLSDSSKEVDKKGIVDAEEVKVSNNVGTEYDDDNDSDLLSSDGASRSSKKDKSSSTRLAAFSTSASNINDSSLPQYKPRHRLIETESGVSFSNSLSLSQLSTNKLNEKSSKYATRATLMTNSPNLFTRNTLGLMDNLSGINSNSSSNNNNNSNYYDRDKDQRDNRVLSLSDISTNNDNNIGDSKGSDSSDFQRPPRKKDYHVLLAKTVESSNLKDGEIASLIGENNKLYTCLCDANDALEKERHNYNKKLYEADQLQTQSDESTRTIQSLKDRLQKLEDDALIVETARSEDSIKILELNRKLSEAKDTIKTIEQQRDNLSESQFVSVLQSNVDRLAAKNDNLIKDNNKLTDLKVSNSSEISKLMSSNESLQADNNIKLTEIKRLKDDIALLQHSCKAISIHFDKAKAELVSDYEKEKSGMKEDYNQLNQQYIIMSEDMKRLKSVNDSNKIQFSRIDEIMRDQQRLISDYKVQIESSKEVKLELTRLQFEFSVIQESNQRLENEKVELQSELQNNTKKNIENIKKLKDDAELRLRASDSNEDKIRKFSHEITDLQSEKDELKRSLDSQIDKYKTLEDEFLTERNQHLADRENYVQVKLGLERVIESLLSQIKESENKRFTIDEAASKEAQALKLKISDLENIYKKDQFTINDLNSKTSQISRIRDQFNEEIEFERKNCSEWKNKHETLSLEYLSEMRQYKDKISSLEYELSTKLKLITSFEDQLQKNHSQIDKDVNTFKSQAETISKAETIHRNLQSELACANTQREIDKMDFRSKESIYLAQIDSLNSKAKLLNGAVEELRAEIASLQDKNAELICTLEESNVQYKNEVQLFRNIETDFEKLTAAHLKLQELNEELQSKLQYSERKWALEKQELQLASDKNQKYLDLEKKLNDDLNISLEAEKSKYAMSTKDLNDLKIEFGKLKIEHTDKMKFSDEKFHAIKSDLNLAEYQCKLMIEDKERCSSENITLNQKLESLAELIEEYKVKNALQSDTISRLNSKELMLNKNIENLTAQSVEGSKNFDRLNSSYQQVAWVVENQLVRSARDDIGSLKRSISDEFANFSSFLSSTSQRLNNETKRLAKSNAILLDKTSKNESELARAKVEIQNKTAECLQLNDELNLSMTNHGSAEQRLAIASKTIEDKEKAIKDLKKANSLSLDDIREKDSRFKYLQANFESVSKDLLESNVKCANLFESKNQLEEQLVGKNAQLNTFTKINSDLNQRLVANQSYISELETQCSTLTNVTSSLELSEKSKRELDLRLDKAKLDMEDLDKKWKSRYESLEKSFSDDQQKKSIKMNEIEEQHNQAKDSNAVLLRKISDLQGALTQKENEIEYGKEHYSKLLLEINEYKSKLSLHEREIISLKDRNVDIEKFCNEWEESSKSHQFNYTKEREKNAKLKKEILDLKETYSKSLLDINLLTSKYSDSEQAILELKESLKGKAVEVSREKERFVKLAEEFTTCKGAMTLLERSKEDALSKIFGLETSFKESSKDNLFLNGQIVKVKEQLHMKDNTLHELKSQLSACKISLDESKESNESGSLARKLLEDEKNLLIQRVDTLQKQRKDDSDSFLGKENELKSTIQELNSSLIVIEDENKKLKLEISNLELHCKEKSDNIEQLETNISGLNEKLSILDEIVRSVEELQVSRDKDVSSLSKKCELALNRLELYKQQLLKCNSVLINKLSGSHNTSSIASARSTDGNQVEGIYESNNNNSNSGKDNSPSKLNVSDLSTSSANSIASSDIHHSLSDDNRIIDWNKSALKSVSCQVDILRRLSCSVNLLDNYDSNIAEGSNAGVLLPNTSFMTKSSGDSLHVSELSPSSKSLFHILEELSKTLQEIVMLKNNGDNTISKQREEILSLNNDVSTRDTLVKQLESKVSILEADLNTYIGDITELENSNYRDIETMKANHKEELNGLEVNHKQEINRLLTKYSDDLKELLNKYSSELKEQQQLLDSKTFECSSMKIELLNCHEKIDSMTNDAEKFEFKYTYEYRKRLELERQIRMLQSNTDANIGEIGRTYRAINSELNSQLLSSDKSSIPLLKPGHTIIRASSGASSSGNSFGIKK